MIEKLRNSVEKTFGKKIICQKDCKLLSNNILETTREYLSPATLRRIFGLLLTNSNPSRVTLDILSRYIGLRDWEHFIDNNRVSSNSHNNMIDTWDRVLEKSKKISISTLDHIKRKSGISFNKTIHRQFADERMNFFIKSEYNSTALIGPGGFGKSTLLANWYEKNSTKKNFSTNIILFLQAISLYSFANSEAYFEDWLLHQLGLSPDYNFLRGILGSGVNPPGKFILIIDALDESSLHGAKMEKVYSSLADFSLKFSTAGWLKIIISARYYTWTKFKPFIENNEKWFCIQPISFSAEEANMPLLTSDEIQKILDNTINSKFSKRTLAEEFSLELKETLSYPFFLQLFIDVFHPENEYLLSDQIEIYREFLNKQVYNAQYSEEKIDILNKILELSDYGLLPDEVKKNVLKEIYPIHLKLAGNYFRAYEDLISFGIIIEEDIENKYGGYSKIIKISNRNLFEILLTKAYLEKENIITISLFKKVAKKYATNEILPNLIIRLYQFAYKDRVVEPLKSFFELDINILNTVLALPNIAITLRKDEYLRKILIPIYTKNNIARKYLFEDYPDINNITGSFSFSLSHYSKNSSNPVEIFYSNIYNVYAGFFALDDGRIERFYRQMEEFPQGNNFNPTIIGMWFACKCMYHILIKNEDPKLVLDQALDHLYGLQKNSNYEYGSFEIPFYNALIITNQHSILAKLTKADELAESKKTIPLSKELRIYRLYSKLTLGTKLDLKDFIEIDLILSLLNPMYNYSLQILGQLLKASYYLNSNEMTKAYDCYRNSTELSNIAGYRILEVKLMKNLSRILLQLGENSKSIECSKLAEHLTRKTNFHFSNL